MKEVFPLFYRRPDGSVEVTGLEIGYVLVSAELMLDFFRHDFFPFKIKKRLPQYDKAEVYYALEIEWSD